jgi:hypothetical protein
MKVRLTEAEKNFYSSNPQSPSFPQELLSVIDRKTRHRHTRKCARAWMKNFSK